MRAIGRSGCAALFAAAAAVATPGVAQAVPSVVGMTYADATQVIQNEGRIVEITTTTGTLLPQSKCIVVNQSERAELSVGRSNTPAKVLLSLNCNDPVAAPGKPGNSAASTAGREQKKKQAEAEWRASPEGQEWCVETFKQHPEWFPQEGCGF